MAVPAVRKTKEPISVSEQLGITREEVERLDASQKARQARMEEALACDQEKNRDRILLKEMLDQSVEILSLVNSGTIAAGGGRAVKQVLELNSNVRELMNDLRGIGTNEDTINFAADQVKDAFNILTQQDLNLQKQVKDEIIKHCPKETASLIIDRMNMLVKGKATMYDELLGMVRGNLLRYLGE